MTLKRLEAQGQIEKVQSERKQIVSNLNRARKDLITAKANLDIDEEWTYTIAYHAMLRAGRALIFASGYRPKGKDQHKTVVEFSAEILGGEFKHLVNRFNRMRIKRHDFIYDTEKPIPRTEAIHSLESAEQFVLEIASRIERTTPQKKMI